eukprot:Selendium_serpulae@DN6375_c0_g1_i9.p1
MEEYKIHGTNSMVEQFMLLANESAAKLILEEFEMHSILRNHPPPNNESLKRLQQQLLLKGITNFKFDSSKELSESLEKCMHKEIPNFNRLVRILTTRCMNQAKYLCTDGGDRLNYRHYGLASDLYTHFTSPIQSSITSVRNRDDSASESSEDLFQDEKPENEGPLLSDAEEDSDRDNDIFADANDTAGPLTNQNASPRAKETPQDKLKRAKLRQVELEVTKLQDSL